MLRQLTPGKPLSERIREAIEAEIDRRETALWVGFDKDAENPSLPHDVGVIRGLVAALEVVKHEEENPEDED